MNQEKIGKYILKCRKRKKFTQEELAEKLGVTSKSISRWENGRTMPDMSLFNPLCNVLGISINEFLSGEDIEKREYQEKLEVNILNTIDYSNKKIKNSKKLFYRIISCMLFIIVSICIMFIIDVRMMNQNREVIFSTWGYKYTPVIDLYDDEIYLSIRNYLVDKSDNELKYYDGKSFVSMKVYLLEEKERNKLYYVSCWVRQGSYYLNNNELKEDSGYSMPFKFKIEKVNDEFIVSDSRYPRDGNYYSLDINNMFDRHVRTQMESVYSDGTIDMLEMEVREQAKLYFHK